MWLKYVAYIGWLMSGISVSAGYTAGVSSIQLALSAGGDAESIGCGGWLQLAYLCRIIRPGILRRRSCRLAVWRGS